MAKFRSIPHEVTAVQWKGEVIPELRMLFGDRDVTVKPAGDPLLVVHTDGEPMFAEVGDWIVRTDHGIGEQGDKQIPVFDLDVMEPEDFEEMYELAEDTKQEFGLEFGIPAVLLAGNSGTEAEVRIKFSGVKASRSALEAIHGQLGAQLGASAPSTPKVWVSVVTQAADRAGLDLQCKACALAVYDGRRATVHEKHCRTIAAIRDRLR